MAKKISVKELLLDKNSTVEGNDTNYIPRQGNFDNYDRNLYIRGGFGGTNILHNLSVERTKEKIKQYDYVNTLVEQEKLFMCYMKYGYLIEEMKMICNKPISQDAISILECYLMNPQHILYGTNCEIKHMTHVRLVEKSIVESKIINDPNASIISKITGNNKISVLETRPTKSKTEIIRLDINMLSDLNKVVLQHPKSEWNISI
jgi:hypothetical protein